MSFIQVDDTRVAVLGAATFGLFVRSERVNIQTDQWLDAPMVSVRYHFEVVVDERSGEDGELSPSASVVALFEDGFTLDLPLGRDLALEPDRGHWEAFLGNDSWSLEGSRIVLSGFDGQSARVTWTAWFGREEAPRSFLFEGIARFDGILVWADDAADLDRAIADTWSPGVLSALTRTEPCVDGEVSPARWSARYVFGPGQSLPSPDGLG